MANERARRLRRSMTPQEVRLWVRLRAWRERGYHFRRQRPHDAYIVDFVCLKHHLVVEIDGGQHAVPNHSASDNIRDESLRSDGFRVLRFWNNEVDGNLDGVLEIIARAVGWRPTPPTARSLSSGRPKAGPGGAVPPPRSGEG